jgi:hypothetical protein
MSAAPPSGPKAVQDLSDAGRAVLLRVLRALDGAPEDEEGLQAARAAFLQAAQTCRTAFAAKKVPASEQSLAELDGLRAAVREKNDALRVVLKDLRDAEFLASRLE